MNRLYKDFLKVLYNNSAVSNPSIHLARGKNVCASSLLLLFAEGKKAL